MDACPRMLIALLEEPSKPDMENRLRVPELRTYNTCYILLESLCKKKALYDSLFLVISA